MVCKECGTYNAENLTHCRVCAAKLRDDDTAVEEKPAREDGKPARDFVKAPSWPTRAFTGAPENQPISPAGAPAPSGSIRPTIPPRPAAPQTVACPLCGKTALADAPFCPYCGTRIVQETASDAPAPVPGTRATARPMSAAVKPAPQPARRVDDFDDDDEYDEDEAPKKPAKKQLAKRPARDLDEYDDEDDEDEYDDEDDDEEFDDMPRKKGKGTTVLFWGLIVLLLALIAVFGMYIARKNFDGDIGKMFASIGSIFNKNGGDAVDPAATEPDVSTESAMYTASISEETDPTTGAEIFAIDINAPTGSVVRVVTEAALTSDTVTIPSNDHVILHIPRDVFMPNKPVDSEVVTITPNLQVVSADGQVTQLTVPEITVTVPALSMTLTEPAADTVTGTYNSAPIPIVGQVNNYDGEIAVFINDEQVYVDSTGMFTSSYTPKTPMISQPTETAAPVDTAADDTATGEDAEDAATGEDAEDAVAEDTAADTVDTGAVSANAETITIEARKNNCVTARKVIVVEPYQMQTMPLLTTNSLESLSSAEGTVTLSGTVTAGAKITATCASTDVTFGEATVSATGTFTLAVSIAKVGAYDIALTGKLDGFYDGNASVTVERPPSDSSSTFKKNCLSLADNYTKVSTGATTSGNFQCTGKITEIISTEPYTIFRVALSDGQEVICVNRSAKSTINSSDLKEKKQVAGSLKGLYTDGKTPLLWCWFIWNK